MKTATRGVRDFKRKRRKKREKQREKDAQAREASLRSPCLSCRWMGFGRCRQRVPTVKRLVPYQAQLTARWYSPQFVPWPVESKCNRYAEGVSLRPYPYPHLDWFVVWWSDDFKLERIEPAVSSSYGDYQWTITRALVPPLGARVDQVDDWTARIRWRTKRGTRTVLAHKVRYMQRPGPPTLSDLLGLRDDD